ncbi:MAG: hypothetical protein DRR19_21610 [Candidatus Parabeggiatoa sp. nov. 1]|nr:MAG: hypothetical protein DRR19_21610 [Gammaproteobacteria bacterium]
MKRLLATLTSAALFGFMCLVSAVQATTPIGTVQRNLVQGQVFAKSDAGERQLTSGSPIYEGDTIETIGDGSVVLLLKDGTMWDIYDESMLTIEKYNFSDDGTDDGATFELHQGQAVYTSGELGDRGAAIAIKTGDNTVYPEGTVISFTFVETIVIIRVIQGRGRIRSRITQTTTTVTVNQYYIDAPSLGTPVVTSSVAVATTTVVRAVQNTPGIKSKGRNKGRSASSIATRIVTRVATATVSRGASTTTYTSTAVEITTTTPGSAGPGLGGGGGGVIVIPLVPASPS